MDASAVDEQENLFADDDHDDEPQAQMDLEMQDGQEGSMHNTQQTEGGTQMNQTANLDALEGAATDVKKKRKTIVQPKLDAARIMGPRGIHTLEHEFRNWKSSGHGREFDDLDKIMHKMNHWAHRMYPKLPFDDTLQIVANRLGKRKTVTCHIKKIRMGMIESVPKKNQDGDDGEGGDVDRYGDDEAEDVPLRPMEQQASVARYDDDDREPVRYQDDEPFVHRYDDPEPDAAAHHVPQPNRPGDDDDDEPIGHDAVNGNDQNNDHQPSQTHVEPVSASPSLDEDKLERMRRNKELALAKRRQRLEQQSQIVT